MSVSELPKPAEKPKSRRGRKPGQEAKVRPPLPNDAFNLVRPNSDNRAQYKRRREDRTDQQLAVDEMAAGSYSDWVKANRPTNWVDMPILVWPVPKSHAETAEFMLRKAAAFLGRRLYCGQIEEKDGVIHIPFCVMDQRERKPREKKPEFETVDDFTAFVREYIEEMGLSLDDFIQIL